MLALFSNPHISGFRPLAFGQDMKHLMRSLPMGRLAIEPAATLTDAQAALRRYCPQVVVFSGHTFMGSLAFENDSGKLEQHTDPNHFATMLLGPYPQPPKLARLLSPPERTPTLRRAMGTGGRDGANRGDGSSPLLSDPERASESQRGSLRGAHTEGPPPRICCRPGSAPLWGWGRRGSAPRRPTTR